MKGWLWNATWRVVLSKQMSIIFIQNIDINQTLAIGNITFTSKSIQFLQKFWYFHIWKACFSLSNAKVRSEMGFSTPGPTKINVPPSVFDNLSHLAICSHFMQLCPNKLEIWQADRHTTDQQQLKSIHFTQTIFHFDILISLTPQSIQTYQPITPDIILLDFTIQTLNLRKQTVFR